MAQYSKQLKDYNGNDIFPITGTTIVFDSEGNNVDSLLSEKESLSNKVTSIASTNTDTQYPSALAVYSALQSIEIETVTSISSSSTDDEVPSAKAVYSAISTKADVATTLSGYGITDAKIESGVITLGSSTITPLTSQDITGKQDVSNLVTALSSTNTDTQYPSAKAVYDVISNNEKTISAALYEHEQTKEEISNKVTSISSGSTDTEYPSAKAVYSAISTKADVATTLSGYGITDAKIESGVITLGSNSITPLTSQDITGKQDVSNLVTALSSESTDTQYPSAKCVYDKISALPTPMQFKGSLGTNGTITELPAASSDNNGYVYKVITDGTYQEISCKSGDSLISNGTEWILIPSGDEPSGTVTSVGVSMNGVLINTITSSGVIDLGTVITSHQDISGKQDVSNLVTALSSTNTDTQYPSAKCVYDVITDNEETITAAINTLNTAKADVATTLSGYGITDAKIESGVITLGSNTITPLTSHQDISGKADVATTLSGYGITDAKISDGTITLGSNTITPLTSHQDISGKQDKSNLVTALSSTNTDTQYPSAKCVYDAIATKISSESIATIWKGTQSEYDDLGTYSSTTLYIIA